jgi:hypothetical protein
MSYGGAGDSERVAAATFWCAEPALTAAQRLAAVSAGCRNRAASAGSPCGGMEGGMGVRTDEGDCGKFYHLTIGQHAAEPFDDRLCDLAPERGGYGDMCGDRPDDAMLTTPRLSS